VQISLDDSCKYLSWHRLGCFSTCIPKLVSVDLENANLRLETGQVTFKFSRGATASKYAYDAYKNKSLSLIYFQAGKECSLDVMCRTKAEHAQWCRALEILVKGVSINIDSLSLTNRYLKFMFDKADVDSR
jgi:hypothetical protein